MSNKRSREFPSKGQTNSHVSCSCLSPNQRSDMGLVLSRRVKQRLYLKRGDRVVAEIEVGKVSGKTVWLYIDADEDLYITRDKERSGKLLQEI